MNFVLRFAMIGICVITSSYSFGKVTDSATATIVNHRVAYLPKPKRGNYLDVKVTPPEARGKSGRVLVEVFNRGKDHLASVSFDVTLMNNSGWSLSAPISAEDLGPNMSGAQWVEIPKMSEKFPVITSAKLAHLRIITKDAREVSLQPYMDLIKN